MKSNYWVFLEVFRFLHDGPSPGTDFSQLKTVAAWQRTEMGDTSSTVCLLTYFCGISISITRGIINTAFAFKTKNKVKLVENSSANAFHCDFLSIRLPHQQIRQKWMALTSIYNLVSPNFINKCHHIFTHSTRFLDLKAVLMFFFVIKWIRRNMSEEGLKYRLGPWPFTSWFWNDGSNKRANENKKYTMKAGIHKKGGGISWWEEPFVIYRGGGRGGSDRKTKFLDP